MDQKRPTVELELLGTDESGATLLELIETTIGARTAAPRPEAGAAAGAEPAAAVPDRLELVAGQEIVLRCGEASITLTRAGKIILRGTYVLSRSSGVNKIKGGSVQIN